ncbi:MAG: hypothetical protein MHPSP_003467, partial [Paramarteilia canceri]
SRSSQDSKNDIIKTLRKFKINFAPKNKIGSLELPIQQSQRLHLYQDKAVKLIKERHAYFCSCFSKRKSFSQEFRISRDYNPRCSCYNSNISYTLSNSFNSNYCIRFK